MPFGFLFLFAPAAKAKVAAGGAWVLDKAGSAFIGATIADWRAKIKNRFRKNDNGQERQLTDARCEITELKAEADELHDELDHRDELIKHYRDTRKELEERLKNKGERVDYPPPPARKRMEKLKSRRKK